MTDPSSSAEDLRAELTGLAGGGGEIGQQANQLIRAIGAERPSPSTSIEALARARWRLDVDTALQSLNAAAAGACPGPLFTQAALSAFGNELPAPNANGTVHLPVSSDFSTSEWPTIGCKTATDIGFAPPEVAVYGCDRGAITVDLTSGSTTLLPDLLPQGENASQASTLTLAGDDLAWISVALTPAKGLRKASWTSTLHVIGVRGNKITARVLQASRHAVDSYGHPEGVSEIVDAGNGWLLISFLRSHDSYTYSLTNPVGNVLGTASFVDGDDQPESVGVIDLGLDPQAYIDERTGQVHPYGGSHRYGPSVRVDDAGCGHDMLVGSEGGFFENNPPPDIVQHFVRGPDGTQVLKAAAKLMVRGGSLDGSDVAALTPDGALLANQSGNHWVFYGYDGRKEWSLGAPVVSVTNAAGHIVALNTSGQQLIIDARNGKEATLPSDIAKILDLLAPNSQDGSSPGQIVLSDPGSDTFLMEAPENSGATLYKASYQAICDSK